MLSRRLLRLLAIGGLLAVRALAAQQPTTSARVALSSVPTNAQIRIQTTAGVRVEGRFVSVNDSSVVVQSDRVDSIPLSGVHVVWLRSASSAGRGAVIGGLVGASGTAAFFSLVFAAFCEFDCDSAAMEGAFVGGLLGAAGGATTGGFVGSFITHWREYWNSRAGRRFTLRPSRVQIIVERASRWRVEPALGAGFPLDGSRTSHLPIAGTLGILRELRPGRGVGFEAGYMDIGGRPPDDPLAVSDNYTVRSSMFSVLGRTSSTTSPLYWVLGAGVGSHQLNGNPAAGAPTQYRETWPLLSIGAGVAWERLDFRARALGPVRLPSGGAVMLLLTIGPRF